jgi:hypothetical protein
MVVLKRLKFAAKSEAFTARQKSLLKDTTDADLQAMELELEQLASVKAALQDRKQPKHWALSAATAGRMLQRQPALWMKHPLTSIRA